MTNRLFKAFYKIHIYVGLFVAVHFAILSVTGAILLFKDEIEGRHNEHSHTASLPENVDTLFQEVLRKYPNERPLALSLEDGEKTIAQLRLGKDNSKNFRGSRRVYIDATTGQEVSKPNKEDSWMNWLLRLHREFLLGSNGKIYVGVIGLLYCFVLISGLFIYGNFSKKSAFGEIRRHNLRSTSSDLHRFLGIATLAWGLAIGSTGMFLGLSSTLIKVFQYSELQKLTEQYPVAPEGPLANLDKVLATAQAAIPNTTFDYLAFPDTQFSPPGHFLVLMHGNTLWTERLVELVVVDARSGELTEVRELPWYLKFGLLSEPLHFGNYGGLGLKILWLVFTLISLSLPIFGLIVWYQRRKKSSGVKTHSQNIKPWTTPAFQRTWVLPVLLALVTLAGVIGTFLTEGYLNRSLAFLLLVPIYFCLRVVRHLWKDR